MTTVFVGDVGTEISLDCGVDVSTATVRNIVVRKQNGGKLTWGAVADGTNAVKHVTILGDLDAPGSWKLQAYVEMPGWKGFGEVATLVVSPPL